MSVITDLLQQGRLRWARRPLWLLGPEAYVTRSFDSTLEALRWEKVRKATRRWAWAGAALGSVVGVVAFAPASWLANAVSRMSGERLLLADAQGRSGKAKRWPCSRVGRAAVMCAPFRVD